MSYSNAERVSAHRAAAYGGNPLDLPIVPGRFPFVRQGEERLIKGSEKAVYQTLAAGTGPVPGGTTCRCVPFS
jgi:hypothetical protein